MKKIFIILSLFICACDNSNDTKNAWNKMIDDIAKQEYQDCVKHAAQEFKDIKLADNKKTCKCVVDYIFSDEMPDDENVNRDIPDRFATDFRAILKEKCGNNIPEYTLRDIPEK